MISSTIYRDDQLDQLRSDRFDHLRVHL